jgi:hypothetical protein
MRRFIADIYVIVFSISGFKILSLVIAIAYISLLNLITVFGLSVLLQEVFPILSYIPPFFTFPRIIFSIIAVLSFNFYLMFPLKNLAKLKNKPMYFTLLLYTSISALLYFYVVFGESWF